MSTEPLVVALGEVTGNIQTGSTSQNYPMSLSESEYLRRLEALAKYPDHSLACRVAEEALRAYPNSAQIWLLRGRLLARRFADGEPVESEIRCSFEKAAELDPNLAEAWEELASYHDGIRDDPKTAMSCWEKAEAVRGQSLKIRSPADQVTRS
jgi:hypothetical protein